MNKLLLVTGVLMALPAQAANDGLSWNGMRCFEQHSYVPHDTEIPPKASYADIQKELGPERMHAFLLKGMEFLRACIIWEDAPIRWSQDRLKVMTAMDAALPITAGRVYASDACGSTLNNAACDLNIEYTIENVTDEFTFTSVAVSCFALLKHDKQSDMSHGSIGWRMGPAHYDPVLGAPLDPHESRRWRMYYPLKYFMNHDPDYIAAFWGSTLVSCHRRQGDNAEERGDNSSAEERQRADPKGRAGVR
jgi:hypothetical protein